MTEPLPAEYLLLSTFSLVPLGPVEALRLARLWGEGQTELTNEQRDLLHTLHREKGQIRWVRTRHDGDGYILTAAGTDALATYWNAHGPALTRRSGPSLGEIARERLTGQKTRAGAA